MTTKSAASLDYWRNYFRNANSDIFSIIDYAILVAASDCPKEFRVRRDRIAEQLFTCRLTRCLGCDRVELAVPGGVNEDDEDRVFKNDFAGVGFEFEAGGSKESKVYSSRDDQRETNMNQVSNYSFGEAEALTDEIEQESQIVGEVFRIRDILNNFEEESDSVLFESLRRLQLMALSVDTLQATEIGKAVNRLRKHASEDIRFLARDLIIEWKGMVDEWVKTTAAVQGALVTPDSKNTSAIEEEDEEEEGLPSPPLDEAAFFTTQPTSMELSQFFDGMDDDGNPRNNGEFIKNRENGRKVSNDNPNPVRCKQQTARDTNVIAKDQRRSQMSEQIVKPNKPTANTNAGNLRPQKFSTEQKANNEMKFQRKLDQPTLQKRNQQDKFKCSDEVAVQVKLEATKRRLQESYQQAENAKKQRTIQVMELHDLPKQGLGHRNPHLKSGLHNRFRANNGRR